MVTEAETRPSVGVGGGQVLAGRRVEFSFAVGTIWWMHPPQPLSVET